LDARFQMGKIAASCGASMGLMGTARGALQLRVSLASLHVNHLTKQVWVAQAQNKFDDNGNLTDDKTREALLDLGATLVNTVKT
jgi:NAD(P)H-dependent FMN reductase